MPGPENCGETLSIHHFIPTSAVLCRLCFCVNLICLVPLFCRCAQTVTFRISTVTMLCSRSNSLSVSSSGLGLAMIRHWILGAVRKKCYFGPLDQKKLAQKQSPP